MTRLLTVSGAVLCVALAHAQGQTGAQPPASSESFATVESQKAFVTANCAGCHAKIDPLGLAFENDDAIGRW